MLRKVMTAALVLTLGLTAAGCSNSTAGTSARHWWDSKLDTANSRAIDAQNESRGPVSGSRYAADREGRVQGYDARTNDTAAGRNAAARAEQAGQDMKNAGRDMANGVKNAARSVGDAAEDALDGMTNAARDYSSQTAQGVNPNGQGTGLNPETEKR